MTDIKRLRPRDSDATQRWAEDFMFSLPDFLLRNKKQLLEMIAAAGRKWFCVAANVIAEGL